MRPGSWLLVATLAVGGCSSVPPPAPAEQRAGAVAALAAEQRWLQSWFQGTPVRIGQPSDAAIAVEVPREFCFDPGRSSIRPPLAAVLDKVSASMHRVPNARLEMLSAPEDQAATAPLGPARAAQLRQYLLGKGVPAATLGAPGVMSAAAVQLRLVVAPP